jgi:hypothetical protein
VVSGVDLDAAVAAERFYESADDPAGSLLYPAADCKDGEHDGEVGVDRLAFVVIDRFASRVVS